MGKSLRKKYSLHKIQLHTRIYIPSFNLFSILFFGLINHKKMQILCSIKFFFCDFFHNFCTLVFWQDIKIHNLLKIWYHKSVLFSELITMSAKTYITTILKLQLNLKFLYFYSWIERDKIANNYLIQNFHFWSFKIFVEKFGYWILKVCTIYKSLQSFLANVWDIVFNKFREQYHLQFNVPSLPVSYRKCTLLNHSSFALLLLLYSWT